MSLHHRIRNGLLCLTVLLMLVGCATTSRDEVSSQPWNRPQSWEGAAGFGGFRPPGSGGY